MCKDKKMRQIKIHGDWRLGLWGYDTGYKMHDEGYKMQDSGLED